MVNRQQSTGGQSVGTVLGHGTHIKPRTGQLIGLLKVSMLDIKSPETFGVLFMNS